MYCKYLVDITLLLCSKYIHTFLGLHVTMNNPNKNTRDVKGGGQEVNRDKMKRCEVKLGGQGLIPTIRYFMA